MLPLVWHLALESEIDLTGSQPTRRGVGWGHPPGKRGSGNGTQEGLSSLIQETLDRRLGQSPEEGVNQPRYPGHTP